MSLTSILVLYREQTMRLTGWWRWGAQLASHWLTALARSSKAPSVDRPTQQEISHSLTHAGLSTEPG